MQTYLISIEQDRSHVVQLFVRILEADSWKTFRIAERETKGTSEHLEKQERKGRFRALLTSRRCLSLASVGETRERGLDRLKQPLRRG